MSWHASAIGRSKAAVQKSVSDQLDACASYNKEVIHSVKDIAYRVIEQFKVAPGHGIKFEASGHTEGGVGSMSFSVSSVPERYFADPVQ